MNMGAKALAVCLVILSAVIWSTGGIMIRSLSQYGLSSNDIGFVRTAVGTVILFAYVVFFDRGLLRPTRKVIVLSLIFGVLWIFSNIANGESFILLPTGLADMIQNMYPYFTIVFAFLLFRDKANCKQIIGVFIATMGCVMFYRYGASGEMPIEGIIVAVVSAILFATGNIGTRAILNEGVSPVGALFYVGLVSMVLDIPFVNLGLIGSLMTTDMSALFEMMFSSIVIGMLPMILVAWAITKIDLTTISILSILEVAFTAILGMVFLGESYDAVCVLGILLIIVSAVVVNLPGRKGRKDGDTGTTDAERPS